jgi:hypothetical protein
MTIQALSPLAPGRPEDVLAHVPPGACAASRSPSGPGG